MKCSILKTIKMARFIIGQFKVFKKLTYLFIIIIGIVYNTMYKAIQYLQNEPFKQLSMSSRTINIVV